jgi:replicative DNA helicase
MNQFNSVAEPTFDLEANVLGSMTLSHDNFSKAQENGLMPDDFITPSFKKAYEVMLEKQTSDIITLQGSLNEYHFDEVRIAAVECISSSGFQHWLKLMHEKTSNRKLLKLAELIPNIVDEDIKVEEKIDKVNQLLVENKITKNLGAPQRANDILKNVEQELKDTENIHRNLIRTGFQGIDKRINGFKKGDLIIVAGRPGMGKTTWALNIATQNILAGKTVLVFSLEMTNEQLMKKIICSQSGLAMDVLLTGDLTKNQWTDFQAAKEKIEKSNLFVYDKSPITIETLINKTKTIQAVQDIDLIIVDYLQLLMTSNKAPSNSDSRAASMTYISNLLKGLAKDIGCPLISLSQLNRGVEARTDKRPVLSDLRDSGSIEQDADMVIMLYRQEYYDSLNTGLAEVIIRKNRLGETGEFELAFDGSRSRFLDPEEAAFGRKEDGPI